MSIWDARSLSPVFDRPEERGAGRRAETADSTSAGRSGAGGTRRDSQRGGVRSLASGKLATDTQQAGQNGLVPLLSGVPRERRPPFWIWLVHENGSDPYEAQLKRLYACWS